MVVKLLVLYQEIRMTTGTMILLIIGVAAAAAVAFIYFRKRRSESLHKSFGPEYERTVHELGDRGKAEAELERRAKRVQKFHIRPLPPDDRERFAVAWRSVQARFVDEPQLAVTEAHELVNNLMRARGYPVSSEFRENAADLSVDHPRVVEHYRMACEIVGRQEAGQADTEDLRKAMVSYRALFEELLGARVNEPVEVRR